MRSLRLILILIFASVLLSSSGCSIMPQKPVVIPIGYMVEIVRPVNFVGKFINKKTGKDEIRTVNAPAGYWVGRLK